VTLPQYHLDPVRKECYRAAAVREFSWGLRPTKGHEDDQVGRTPWSARVPLDPLFAARSHSQLADVGVGCGPGGPPHLASHG
jgi:hypothetical protein